jgi:molecular chaperone DnaK
MTSILIDMPTNFALARTGSRLAVIALIALSACSHSGAPPSLGDSISVEQAGGGATQLIASGTQLPSSATESFTTAHDGEKKLYIHVLRGSAKKVGKLSSDSWWTVDGVPDAPAGVARVFVTFEFDAKGDLTLSARQDAVKLKAARLDKAPDGQKPSPLTEPDDDDEGPDESE